MKSMYSASGLMWVMLIPSLCYGCTKSDNSGTPGTTSVVLVNHSSTELSSIPSAAITEAKQQLHIAYGHTSHGSQLIDGMSGLVDFKGGLYAWNEGGSGGALDIRDYAMPGDLGNPDWTAWESETRTYLAENADINVVIWSWCGEVSYASEANINTYLNLMSGLENDFKNVKFVYMTGHLDGTGLTGNLHIRNQQIRDFCKNNKKILYDFEDIESYNPDGVYFGDKKPDDGCNYDSDGDGSADANWATEWQASHTSGTDWYDCGAAHTQPVNANMKAYAAWWLWASIAGWSGN
jgi:hypothetical protein